MKKYIFTIGLFDKDTEQLETTREDARELLAYILIDEFELFTFTMFDCFGVYRMESTGRIVREPSIRVEVATDTEIPAADIIHCIKSALNQETVMLEVTESNISFI